jgi:hypothetical protein
MPYVPALRTFASIANRNFEGGGYTQFVCQSRPRPQLERIICSHRSGLPFWNQDDTVFERLHTLRCPDSEQITKSIADRPLLLDYGAVDHVGICVGLPSNLETLRITRAALGGLVHLTLPHIRHLYIDAYEVYNVTGYMLRWDALCAFQLDTLELQHGCQYVGLAERFGAKVDALWRDFGDAGPVPFKRVVMRCVHACFRYDSGAVALKVFCEGRAAFERVRGVDVGFTVI